MKYIKLFESHDNLYVGVDRVEYLEVICGELEIISALEYNYLNSNVSHKYINYLNRKTCIEISTDVMGYGKLYLINKTNDDWWYVNEQIFPSKDEPRAANKYFYYKCDQWDGLLKFLNDRRILIR